MLEIIENSCSFSLDLSNGGLNFGLFDHLFDNSSIYSGYAVAWESEGENFSN